MNVLIISGGSKGLGRAIVDRYQEANYSVFSMSRTLVGLNNVFEFKVDLSDVDMAVETLRYIYNQLVLDKITSITLVHNAARLGEISPMGALNTLDIQTSFNLNVVTPYVLSNEFVKLTKHQVFKKQILSISSGAAVNPYSGWSVYCGAKASIEMMTKNIAKEQDGVMNGVTCFAVRPGVVDTAMQEQIRETSVNQFKSVQRFIDLKMNNELFSPKFVADKIYSLDVGNRLKNGDIVDIRKI